MRITIPPMTFEVEDLKEKLKRPPVKLQKDLEAAIRDRLDGWCFLSICWGHELEARLVLDKSLEIEQTAIDSQGILI